MDMTRGPKAAVAGGPVTGHLLAAAGPRDRLWVPTPATPSPGDEDSLGKGRPRRHTSRGQSRHHAHPLRHTPVPPQNRVTHRSHYRALHKPLARPCTLRHTCVSCPTHGGDLEDTLSWVVQIMTALLLTQLALQATGANRSEVRSCLRPVSTCWAPAVAGGGGPTDDARRPRGLALWGRWRARGKTQRAVPRYNVRPHGVWGSSRPSRQVGRGPRGPSTHAPGRAQSLGQMREMPHGKGRCSPARAPFLPHGPRPCPWGQRRHRPRSCGTPSDVTTPRLGPSHDTRGPLPLKLCRLTFPTLLSSAGLDHKRGRSRRQL